MAEILQIALHHIVPFLVVISVVVFVHEFGHYWVARQCGVRIDTFSIGFGPEIFGWNDKHGTRWQVCWLPLGGYVKMFGDADPASTPGAEVHQMNDEEKKVAFFHQSVGERIAIVAAGPGANYIFAVVVLALLFGIKGQPYTPADVNTVSDHGPAAMAGIKPGDHIATVDGAPIERFEDLKRIVSFNEGAPLDIEIIRAGKSMHFKVTPELMSATDPTPADSKDSKAAKDSPAASPASEEKTRRIGISSDKLKYRDLSPVQAVQQAFVETWNITSMSLQAIGQMVVGKRGAEGLGGPLRIAEMSSKVAEDGVVSLVRFMALISISLGFINLFPVPLLDGGHIVFFAVEWAKGSPLSMRVQEIGTRIGLVLVVMLMVVATWNDLVHLKIVSYIRSYF